MDARPGRPLRSARRSPDTEHDGLIDALGDRAVRRSAPTRIPTGTDYPRLWAMGASTDAEGSLRRGQQHGGRRRTRRTARPTHPFPLAGQDPDGNGVVTDAAGHDHRPLPTTLTMVGDALLRAGVHVHFDVGPLANGGTGYTVGGVFRPFPAATPGDDRVPATPPRRPTSSTKTPRGGESIPEDAVRRRRRRRTRCASSRPSRAPSAGSSSSSCVRDGSSTPTTGERRFDPMRNGFFHYLLYAHARGSANSPFPCLTTAPSAEGFDPPPASAPSWV